MKSSKLIVVMVLALYVNVVCTFNYKNEKEEEEETKNKLFLSHLNDNKENVQYYDNFIDNNYEDNDNIDHDAGVNETEGILSEKNTKKNNTPEYNDTKVKEVRIIDTTALDKRPGSKRVRNALGAQVGRIAGSPVKLKYRENGIYVMSAIPLENAGDNIRETYQMMGISYRNSSDTFFTVSEWESIYIDSDIYAVVKLQNVKTEGEYIVTYLVSDYLSKEPCNEDVCFVCDGDGQSCLDCEGVPFGQTYIDYCGICGGMNRNMDYHGSCCLNGTIINGTCT